MAPDELTISLAEFEQSLIHTPDFVLVRVLRRFHGTEKHTESEWRSVMDGLRNLPVK